MTNRREELLMANDIRTRLKIDMKRLEEINNFLIKPDNKIINNFLKVVENYGTPEEINKKAREASKLDNLMGKLKKKNFSYYKDLQWLIEQRDKGAFINIDEYRKNVLGEKIERVKFNQEYVVTLEISACQYFSCFMAQARRAIDKKELMPGRFIRVRAMKEQEEDHDLLAMTAAMKILGASWCETLDTKGADGSNIHLGGPETITGYFGGVGQPNDYPIKWVDEFLYYYTNYGVRQVLNINPGTILLGYLMHKIGLDIDFKISVFMGNDNPYAVFWTLMVARLFSREDDTTSLAGFNFSNSVNNTTIELSSEIRKSLGLEDFIRFEHHILETYKSIVIQPYDRRNELLEIAPKVKNISAKHEGGEVEVDKKREHPSDILDYFIPRKEIEAQGLMSAITQNYLDKHEAVNNTARALTEKGLSFIAAPKLHHKKE
jgi:bifunctional DNA-binding transcriptional regulator/antitoxin component of YhaV-PrlF toxin-antitoxin module